MLDKDGSGMTLGAVIALVCTWWVRISTARRVVKRNSADADAFTRLTVIADRAEKQLAIQTSAIEQERIHLKSQVDAALEQVKKLSIESATYKAKLEASETIISELKAINAAFLPSSPSEVENKD